MEAWGLFQRKRGKRPHILRGERMFWGGGPCHLPFPCLRGVHCKELGRGILKSLAGRKCSGGIGGEIRNTQHIRGVYIYTYIYIYLYMYCLCRMVALSHGWFTYHSIAQGARKHK